MNDELITVVIPIFNSSLYLEECLNSVIDQTYKHIEIIAINDGSTDNSMEILEKFSLQYSCIKIINQENSGQSVARNKGIDIANGKYIYFLDSDDYIMPNTFEILVEIMKANKIDLVRFSADVFLDSTNDKINQSKYKFDDIFTSGKIYNKEEFLLLTKRAYSASPVLYFMKTQFLIDNNLRFKPGIIHEDDLFSLEVFLNTNKAIYLSNVFYNRRIRPESTMTTKSIKGRKKSFISRRIILEELFKLLNKYTDENESMLIKSRIKKITIMLGRNYNDLRFKFKKNEMKNLSIPSIRKRYCYYHFKHKLSVLLNKIK